MKLSKLSNFVGFSITKSDDYIQNVDTDLINIFNCFKGRVRFGAVTNGYRGENMEGEFRVFTSATSAGNTTVVHTLGATPVGFILVNKGGFGDIYMASANTANVAFATSLTSTSYSVFLLK
jgi:hypothetical protein